jgi:2-polyprenyl-6-methoxyphenol hydroxylase-like FAD-dependent oxidoreductase
MPHCRQDDGGLSPSAALDLVIVGGGPAGMMAGLLFARAGVRTTVVEKHADFLRDFRGDTVHPSTLDIIDDLGLLDAFLELPHDKVTDVSAVIGGRTWQIADFSHLPGRARFIAMMPQWHFLDFLAREARRYPSFALRMLAEAAGLIEEDGRVVGVRLAGGEAIRAGLTMAADGRGSRLRTAADLPLEDLGAPIDVFWFRVPKAPSVDNQTQGFLARGEMIVTIDRGDYFQCARVIAKGGADAVRARGLDAFRRDVARAAPILADEIAALTRWDEVKLLSVSLDRLQRWHRPGLLAIGDAAHAMSPVGGVGINLAVQDAVAAANILAAPLAAGQDIDRLLAAVQARRMLPVRVVQGIQAAIHRRVLGPALAGQVDEAPWPVRMLDRLPLLQRVPARILGLGLRREHVRSPEA